MKIPLLGESVKLNPSDTERELIRLAKNRVSEHTSYAVSDIGVSKIFLSQDISQYRCLSSQ